MYAIIDSLIRSFVTLGTRMAHRIADEFNTINYQSLSIYKKKKKKVRERKGNRERERERERGKKYECHGGSRRYTRCQRGTVCPLFTGVTAGWNCHCLKICLHPGVEIYGRDSAQRRPVAFIFPPFVSPRTSHCSMEPKEKEKER